METVETLQVYIWHIEAETNGRHFADDIFKCIFLNENVWIQIKISLKLVPKGPIKNNPALVRIMAWCRPGDKLLSEPMVVRLPTHICVAQHQWLKVMCWMPVSSYERLVTQWNINKKNHPLLYFSRHYFYIYMKNSSHGWWALTKNNPLMHIQNARDFKLIKNKQNRLYRLIS